MKKVEEVNPKLLAPVAKKQEEIKHVSFPENK